MHNDYYCLQAAETFTYAILVSWLRINGENYTTLKNTAGTTVFTYTCQDHGSKTTLVIKLSVQKITDAPQSLMYNSNSIFRFSNTWKTQMKM